MAKKENIASVLAFEKKLVPSDGYMYGTRWECRSEVQPLCLQEKSVRGTISNRLKAAVKSDPAKLNAEVEKANLQTVDTCSLGPEQDTLKLHFTLKVLGGIHKPSACNNATFKQSYAKAACEYAETQRYKELARRYALNIANGRFLWRNRVGVDAVEVVVNVLNTGSEQEWVFDATQFSLRNFESKDSNVNSLAERIATVLASEDDYLLLDIACYAKVGRAQEVYPSEELVLDKGKGEKSKILYSYDDDRKAAMHSQKLGNALRTIDTWYPDFDNAEESAGPIAIEPYGAVTNLGKAYRTPKEKQDFYTLFDNWARGEALPRLEDQHYVMAVLVRGGVFGQSDK
ncbi:type I-F CRISPR-associated protein Csy3 [Parendozoicomonas sp. Alg238-R29]|uniref:type I-F CRISPR-associated protein Csy3 n=1 Tax=Parendozoicomonas sp. Alg238-R29 TaxID=2993446 RepID=UPI00248F0EA5|nr:type I-F CRISPR-associated protein Csy3 [Parendozoicomonas sp. Alg238-R29]